MISQRTTDGGRLGTDGSFCTRSCNAGHPALGRPADETVGNRGRAFKPVTRTERGDLAYAFFVFRKSDDVLVGGLTLANIRRGCAQAGSLGYWMGAAYARQGHMTAAVTAIIPFAFGTLKLHRIEAACIPANVASVRLLERTGFKREGFARQYLCIDGAWQDHLLYARIKDDPSP